MFCVSAAVAVFGTSTRRLICRYFRTFSTFHIPHYLSRRATYYTPPCVFGVGRLSEGGKIVLVPAWVSSGRLRFGFSESWRFPLPGGISIVQRTVQHQRRRRSLPRFRHGGECCDRIHICDEYVFRYSIRRIVRGILVLFPRRLLCLRHTDVSIFCIISVVLCCVFFFHPPADGAK